MREKASAETHPSQEESARRGVRISGELQSRGVETAVAKLIAGHLQSMPVNLDGESYEAFLAGISLACRIHRESGQNLDQATESIEEVERLMRAFVGELGKLEEALQVLGAHVRRMRVQTRFHTGRTVH